MIGNSLCTESRSSSGVLLNVLESFAPSDVILLPSPPTRLGDCELFLCGEASMTIADGDGERLLVLRGWMDVEREK